MLKINYQKLLKHCLNLKEVDDTIYMVNKSGNKIYMINRGDRINYIINGEEKELGVCERITIKPYDNVKIVGNCELDFRFAESKLKIVKGEENVRH